jgi:hypothetical protein
MAIADAVDDGKLPASVQSSVQNQCGHTEQTRMRYYNPKRRMRDADISSNAFDKATGWRERYGVSPSRSPQQYRPSQLMESSRWQRAVESPTRSQQQHRSSQMMESTDDISNDSDGGSGRKDDYLCCSQLPLFTKHVITYYSSYGVKERSLDATGRGILSSISYTAK